MSNLEIFIRQIRSRSAEHKKAMNILAEYHLRGQMIAILRQELDSMIRVIYLLKQQTDLRAALIDSCVRGERWRISGKIVTDKDMVNLATQLHGWSAVVYKFACAFIHLSALHDYNDRDPLSLLPICERIDILEYCRNYHGGPQNKDADFADLVTYIPNVLSKIAGNLECYLDDL